jgi:hypothetical protein
MINDFSELDNASGMARNTIGTLFDKMAADIGRTQVDMNNSCYALPSRFIFPISLQVAFIAAR